MSASCCSSHNRYTKNLLWRAGSLLALGALLFIPALEDLLSVGAPGLAFFAASSALLIESIRWDFPSKKYSCLCFAISFCAALFAPFVRSSLVANLLIGQSIATISGILFVSYPACVNRLSQLLGFNVVTANHKKPPILNYPTSESTLLLFAVLNWGLTLASFLSPVKALYRNALHDALLILGITSMSSWVKQRTQTKLVAHNHGQMITIIDEHKQEKSIPASALRKGMYVVIKQSTLIPVAVEAADDTCLITQNHAEKRVCVQNKAPIEANTIIHRGTLLCKEDYHSIDHKVQRQQNEDSDALLSSFMVFSLVAAFTTGLRQGLLLQSFTAGIERFCLNLMAACPCVFMVSKPIIQSKFLSWLQKNSAIAFNRMPTCKKPNILVFDRTHTLYDENPEDPDGPYIIKPSVKDMLRDLKNQGITLYILSGHGTGNHIGNLAACKAELQGIISDKRIRFHKKYHDAQTAEKKEVISNLQLYGSFDAPEHYLSRIFCYLKRLFRPNIVGMIGDGSNDSAAIEQAHFSVCVGKSRDSFNNQALRASHFCCAQNDLPDLASLVNIFGNMQKNVGRFTIAALTYNLCMMLCVNGLFTFFTGLAFSSVTACVGVSFSCVTLGLLASLTAITPPTKSIKQPLCDDACHNTCCLASSRLKPKTPSEKKHQNCSTPVCPQPCCKPNK